MTHDSGPTIQSTMSAIAEIGRACRRANDATARAFVEFAKRYVEASRARD